MKLFGESFDSLARQREQARRFQFDVARTAASNAQQAAAQDNANRLAQAQLQQAALNRQAALQSSANQQQAYAAQRQNADVLSTIQGLQRSKAMAGQAMAESDMEKKKFELEKAKFRADSSNDQSRNIQNVVEMIADGRITDPITASQWLKQSGAGDGFVQSIIGQMSGFVGEREARDRELQQQAAAATAALKGDVPFGVYNEVINEGPNASWLPWGNSKKDVADASMQASSRAMQIMKEAGLDPKNTIFDQKTGAFKVLPTVQYDYDLPVEDNTYRGPVPNRAWVPLRGLRGKLQPTGR